MKKLMVAAAVAAMATGAFAAPENTTPGQFLIYNFSASLRTTRGVPGASIVTPRTAQIGHDGTAAQNYWYTDAAVAGNNIVLSNVDLDGDGTPDWDVNGDGVVNAADDVTIPNAVTAMTATGRHLVLGAFAQAYWVDATGATPVNKLVNDANTVKKAFATYMAPLYPAPNSAGVFCATVTWTETDPANCYRVAGATTLNGLLISDNCCGTGFTQYDTVVGSDPFAIGGASIDPTVAVGGLNYYFGSQAYNLANQVEVYAQVVGFDNFTGWLAGQGTLFAPDRTAGLTVKKRINMLSGNIVGTLPPSQCVYFCCVPDTIARVFACDDDTVQTAAALAGMRTAAFGTFVIRYNPAITAQYNAAGSTMPR